MATGSLGLLRASSRLQASSAVQASKPVRRRAQIRRLRSRISPGEATILLRPCVSTCVRPPGSRTVTATVGPGALSRRSASPCDLQVGRDPLAVDGDHLRRDRYGGLPARQGADDQLALGRDVEVQVELVDRRLDAIARADGVEGADDDGQDRESKQQDPERAQPAWPNDRARPVTARVVEAALSRTSSEPVPQSQLNRAMVTGFNGG